VQQPLAGRAFDDVMTVPAWKLVPSWYLVAQGDQALPPDVERMFTSRIGATTAEVPSGHLAMVSHPAEVAKLTETAAEAALAVNAVDRTRRSGRRVDQLTRDPVGDVFGIWSGEPEDDVSEAGIDGLRDRTLGRDGLVV
jgi:hypothetical protein